MKLNRKMVYQHKVAIKEKIMRRLPVYLLVDTSRLHDGRSY